MFLIVIIVKTIFVRLNAIIKEFRILQYYLITYNTFLYNIYGVSNLDFIKYVC